MNTYYNRFDMKKFLNNSMNKTMFVGIVDINLTLLTPHGSMFPVRNEECEYARQAAFSRILVSEALTELNYGEA